MKTDRARTTRKQRFLTAVHNHHKHDANAVTRRPIERGVEPQRHRPRSPTGWRLH